MNDKTDNCIADRQMATSESKAISNIRFRLFGGTIGVPTNNWKVWED